MNLVAISLDEQKMGERSKGFPVALQASLGRVDAPVE
jgi:hypothetical protein